jgi:hypothetical protein
MRKWTWLLAAALLPGCDGGKNDDDGGGSTGSPTGDPTTDPTDGGGDDPAKVPPVTGKTDVRAWLAEGHYKSWTCQAGVVDPIPISPHGKQRICINGILKGHGNTAGEFPVDSAAVKELYDAAGAEIVGYAVYRHVTPGAGGETWYWFEEVPDDSPAPHDADGIVADGLGSSGPAKDICVGCHMAAGIDADHPGHDMVYTPTI